jgi:hypothetical protein
MCDFENIGDTEVFAALAGDNAERWSAPVE